MCEQGSQWEVEVLIAWAWFSLGGRGQGDENLGLTRKSVVSERG